MNRERVVLGVVVLTGFLALHAFSDEPPFSYLSPLGRSAALERANRPSLRQTRLRHIYVVMPVYRELYNNNLAQRLCELAQQTFMGERIPITLIAVVNHTAETPALVKQENHYTVEMLRALEQKQIPVFLPGQERLAVAAAAVAHSPLKLQVLTVMSPEYHQRNIGWVRNVGSQHVLSGIQGKADGQADHVAIAQMDADTRIPPFFAEVMQNIFSDSNVDYALLEMQLGMQSGSRPWLFKRWSYYALQYALSELTTALSGVLPNGGAPRIVTRASTLEQVGGVPEIDRGEDRLLTQHLKDQFRGVYAVGLSVEPALRARPDGYDSAVYLHDKQDQLDHHGFLMFAQRLYNQHTNLLSASNSESLWQDELDALLENRTQRIRQRVERIHLWLSQLTSQEPQPTYLPSDNDPLLESHWFRPLFIKALKDAHGNENLAWSAVRGLLPGWLDISATAEHHAIFKAHALARFLWWQKQTTNAKKKRSQPTPSCHFLIEGASRAVGN